MKARERLQKLDQVGAFPNPSAAVFFAKAADYKNWIRK